MKIESFSKEMEQKIPILKALGIQWLELQSNLVSLQAPLQPNINHVQSVFGGSIYSAMAICCYGLFRVYTEQSGLTDQSLVIQNGRIEYLKPLKTDFIVVAKVDDEKKWELFKNSVSRHGKGRLEVTALAFEKDKYLSHSSEPAAKFVGQYVYL